MSSTAAVSKDDQIQILKLEIQEAKNTMNELIEKNRSLVAQRDEFSSKCSNLTRVELQNRELIEKINEKNAKIENLEADKLNIIKQRDETLREMKIQYLKEITYLKNQHENNIQKIEAASVVIKLNEKQHNKILELEKDMKDLIEHEKEILKQCEMKHENQFTNLKKKMMDHIKTAQKNMAQSNLDNLDLNTKLSRLATNQLLIELEEQSTQIEDLLKLKEKYEKEIFMLKTDLSTHKKVEQILQEKNKKYLDMVKACDKKIVKKTLEDEKGEIKYPSLTEHKVDIGLSSNRNYEKLYRKQFREYQDLKEVYQSLRDKEKNYETKFGNIIDLYKMAIDDLVNDEEFKNLKDVYVNVDEIKKGNFEKFNKKEKYSILTLLIKNLLPLINSDENEKVRDLKMQFGGIEINGHNETSRNFFDSTKTYSKFGRTYNTSKYTSFNKTFSKFPKIEHLMRDSAKNKKSPALCRFLNIK